MMVKTKDEQEAVANEKVPLFAENSKFMRAHYYGTYVVPHPDRLDKKIEKRFRVSVVVPKSLLQHNMNFHSHFKRTQVDVFRERNPEFVRFQNICFDHATNIDGSEINDPRTFSLDRLKRHCIDQGWEIDFHLYPGLKLRDVVFQFFLRQDKKDETEAFRLKQENDRKLYGLNASLRAEMESVPKGERVKFEEG